MNKWIKNILGITQLEEELSSSKKVIANLRDHEKFACNEIAQLKSLIEVGADIHVHNERENWAVVCVKGKPDYVKFVHLGHREVRDIQRFLSQFDRKNVTLDLPPQVDRRRYLHF